MKIINHRVGMLVALVGLLGSCGTSGGGDGSGFNTGTNMEVITTALADGTINTPYSTRILVSGGIPPYSFTLATGSLPGGMSLSETTGDILGTPSSNGTFPMLVNVSDNASPPSTRQASLTLSINTGPTHGSPLSLIKAPLPAATVGTAYSHNIGATGGLTPYSFYVISGSLPTGLTLSQAGNISGTPAAPGVFRFDVEVVDSAQNQGNDLYTFTLSVSNPSTVDPAVVATASRTTGVAPLAVFFDATGTTASTTTKPFHELYYHWDFADPTSRRPTATGAVASHVFNNPGFYRVLLSVKDHDYNTQTPQGSVVTKEFIITVLDPDQVFAGSNTICFSNTSDFTGAPQGALQVQTNSFATAIGNHLATGKRLLFRRGHTFSAYSTVSLEVNGPVHVGAFGLGNSPDVRGIHTNNPAINITSPGQWDAGIRLNDATDVRITDLKVTVPGSMWSCLYSRISCDKLLMQRLSLVGSNITMTVTGSDIAIADCHVSGSTGKGIYGDTAGLSNLAVLGNYLDVAETHLLRIAYVVKGVISGNEFSYSNTNLHLLKLHAPHSTPRLYSEYVVVNDNQFNHREGWPVAIGPQNNVYDERVRDVVVERNTFNAQSGNSLPLVLWSQDVTVRNNLFIDKYSSVSLYTKYFILVDKRGIEPAATGVAIYHNTFYCNHAGYQEVFLASIGTTGDKVRMENNLVYSPLAVRTCSLVRSTSNCTIGGNLVNVNPNFENPAANDYRLKQGSPAIDAGNHVPVSDDMAGITRISKSLVPDVGALESH